MLSQYKIIIDDLLKYLIEGIHEGAPADGFDGIAFDSTAITNIKYQFIRRYEQAESINDPNTLPVLVVTQPDMYLNGKILYRGQFVDLRTVLIKEKTSNDELIGKIKFFVIPHLTGIQGSNLGSINYDLKVDFVADFDTYGFMSKEIDSILKRHYFKKFKGDYYYINGPDNYSNLFFIPTNSRVLNQASLLNRIAQSYRIRFCSLV
jgi:hypothetical protein